MDTNTQKLNRRRFLLQSSLAAASLSVAGKVAAAATSDDKGLAKGAPGSFWDSVRQQFPLDSSLVHLSSFYFVSHPQPVRDAIARFRAMLDANPYQTVAEGCWGEGSFNQGMRVKRAAAQYLGGRPEEVALTQSTTMGLSLVYWGLRLRPGDEMLTTTHDHFVHHEAMRIAAQRSGATVRKVALYDRLEDLPGITEGAIIERIQRAVTPSTRVVGLTWVYSSSGLRLPIRAVVAAVRQRAPEALIVLDGLHGFGAVDETVADIGIDVFVSGTHKWIFGPRGTGLVWAPERVWAQLQPFIPTFDSLEPEDAWMAGIEPKPPAHAAWFSPGGFHAFEHEWAVADAFEFHQAIGRKRGADRITALNTLIKDGLAGMRHVRLWTPRDPTLSAGLVGFDLAGLSAKETRDRLWQVKIVATASPYARSVARLSAGIMNNEEDVTQALQAIRKLAI